MASPLFCFGYGYSARALGARVLARGGRVIATARDAAKARSLCEEGVEAHPWPADLDTALPEGAHVLVSAAPGPQGDPVLAEHASAMERLSGRVAWLGYLSTTAVYGDRQGGMVDESSALMAGTQRGKARVAAESAWRALAGRAGLPLHIFRLAGIYGPGRSPFEKLRARKGTMTVKKGQVFGRIHVEDIATVLEASMASPNPGAAYNVTDDLTCPPQEVMTHAAALIGLPAPEPVDFEKAELSAMARSFYAENKRVANDRMHHELGVTLAYPTYREGLAAVLTAENG